MELRSGKRKLDADTPLKRGARQRFDASLYADVAFYEVFQRCDRRTMLGVKRACRRFYGLLDERFFADACARDGVTLPPPTLRAAIDALPEGDEKDVFFDVEKIYIGNPYRENLAPVFDCSLEEMEAKRRYRYTRGWVKLEEPPIGLPKENEVLVERCIATSYSWGERRVEIDLVQQGVQEWVLDRLRPRIVVTELVSPRFDCASQYAGWVQLLQPGEAFDFRRRNGTRRMQKIVKIWPQWSKTSWQEVRFVFDDYPVGVRKVCVVSGGKDRQCWAGEYGAKFANLKIRIELPTTLRLLEPTAFPDDAVVRRRYGYEWDVTDDEQ